MNRKIRWQKAGDLGGIKPVFMLVEPADRPRSQSTHSSETGKPEWSEGCRKVETL